MAADLVARLYLQSQGFDRSIEESTKKVRKFQKETDSAGKGVKTFTGGLDMSIPGLGKMVSGVGKLAGAFGLTVGAMEVFDKAINSNSHLQDQYNTTVKAGKEVIDDFFSSLYSGNWDVFNEGILRAIENAKTYSQEYMNIMRMLDVTAARYERVDAEKNRLESIVEDESKSMKERKAAQNQLDRILMMGIADVREAARQTEETLAKRLSKYGIEGNIGNAQKLIEDLYNPYSQARTDAETYRRNRDNTTGLGGALFRGRDYNAWQQSLEAMKKYTDKEKQVLESYIRVIDSLTEEEYQSLKELFDRRSDLIDKAGTWEKDRTGARDEIFGTSAGTSKQKEIIPEGSILELQRKIASLRDDFQKATDEGTRAGFSLAIKQAETELRMMNERSQGTSLITSGIGTKAGRNPTTDIQSGYIKAPEIKAATAANYEYASSLEGIASIMGSITNLTSEGAGAWISYATNVMTAAAQAIPAIKAITNAQAQQAVTGAAASAAAIPVVGWITAAAAVASVIAAMTSVPKFAGGGIVPGSSFYGDRVPALVNSGEMILNRSQQSNLFSMLQGTGRRSSEVIVSGELIARGRDLVAVINKQDRFNQRVR